MCRLGQQQRNLYCPFDLPVRYHRGDLFEHVQYVQVSFLRYYSVLPVIEFKGRPHKLHLIVERTFLLQVLVCVYQWKQTTGT